MSVIFGADRRLPAAVRTYNGSYAKISHIRTHVDALRDVSYTSGCFDLDVCTFDALPQKKIEVSGINSIP